MIYQPQRVFVDKDALAFGYCEKILKTLHPLKPIILSSSEALDAFVPSDISLSKGKQFLHLKNFKADAFKLCPGFTKDILCCNYYVLDLIENCPLECTYCILQAFLNKSVITFHVNVEELVETMIATIKSRPQQPFRIGTGEHSDSLALDHIFQVNPYLVDVFSGLDNATLELKTKTDLIGPLLGLDHRGKTVVSWSLNPSEIIRANELKTASLEDRLKAANRLEKDGYKIGFHFDPLIHYENWERGYSRTIDLMLEAVQPENIAWISLGTLRYIPSLKQIAEERFPRISIFSNEFVAAEDGKMRYIKPLRKTMLLRVSKWIQEKAPNIPLYLCMEKHAIWKQMCNNYPQTPEELESYLNSNL
ncbi:DNA photolyase [bacterium]|nr:DNA photolyase [bacterium]